jgi:hypothetical protein
MSLEITLPGSQGKSDQSKPHQGSSPQYSSGGNVADKDSGKKKPSKSQGSSTQDQQATTKPGDVLTAELDPFALLTDVDPDNASPEARLEKIQQSHALLQHFTPKELRTLLNLKRNTSPKAWTLREDLVVLLLPHSNREIAAMLQDRNKEAVKKRLQLLRSKGLIKRAPEAEGQET